MLIVFGGLPATGKTTVSRALADHLGALHLRIDTIEEAARRALDLGRDVGASGYEIAMAVARDNLSAGRIVIADAVNPITLTRNGWRGVAVEAAASLLEIETVVSDRAEHRQRVETRRADIPGAALPSWADVLARPYEPWDTIALRIDTARLSPEEAVRAILPLVEARRGQPRLAR